MSIIFGRFLHRPMMRWMHRHDFHHAPVIGPFIPDGGYQRWCHWCGFRESYRVDPRTPAARIQGEAPVNPKALYRDPSGEWRHALHDPRIRGEAP